MGAPADGVGRSSAEHQAPVPAEQSGWRHRERLRPTGRRQQAAQEGQHRSIGWLVRRATHLPAEYGDLLAHGQQLDFFRFAGPTQQDDELDQASADEEDEGPELSLGPASPHSAGQ